MTDSAALQGLRARVEATDTDVRPTIYIASKTAHADRWRFLRDKLGDRIISTWIDEAGAGETLDWPDLWGRCLIEAANADILIIYCEPGETLKGAWIECGVALAAHARVFGVGIEDFSIAKSGRIRQFPSMKAAIAAAREIVP